MIPKRSGDRVKTDRRDAEMLARLYRAGELSAVYVPHPEDEAVRDLTRAREDAKQAQTRARHQLKAFLLRSGIGYTGKTAWTPAHVRWIAGIKLDQPVQQIVFQEYVEAVTAASDRLERVEGNLRDAVAEWRLKPLVEALQALRGVQLVVATTLAAEIGRIDRFDNPRQLMAYLGLVPSEYSSGSSTRRGSITKCGNTHARRVLTEAAWAYRAAGAHHADHRPAPGQARQKYPRHRLEGATAPVQALSQPARQGQGAEQGHHRRRPRTLRLRLGHRSRSVGRRHERRLIHRRCAPCVRGACAPRLWISLGLWSWEALNTWRCL